MAKQTLRENTLVPAKMVEKLDLPLQEETVKGTPYKALAIYRFPFTRPGQKNLNGRIYPYALWDKVFREFKSRSTLCLMDHPEDGPGDPTRVWAVARNPRYSDDRTLAYVDCYILDNEHGKTINGILEAGGDIGLSTSGIGDFEPDGITVCPESYELERFFDAVLQPSYSVFGSLDDKISESLEEDNRSSYEKKAKFSLQGKGNAWYTDDLKLALKWKKNGYRVYLNNPERDNPLTLKDLESMKESEDLDESIDNFGGNKMTLREKRELEASLKKIYEDVKEIHDFRERLDRAKEALTFYEDIEVESYKREFEELVAEAEQEFENALAKSEQADDAIKEAEDVAKENDDLKKEAEDLKKENNDLKKENAQLKEKLAKTTEEYKSSVRLVDNIAKDIRRKINYDSYAELREYAIKATEMYSKMKEECNFLRSSLDELNREKLAFIQEAKLREQKEQLAKARADQARIAREQASALAEKQLQEAKEAEFLRNVNPDVLDYYNDTAARLGESVKSLRTQILSKRTLGEAELFVLKELQKNVSLQETTPLRDISTPLPVTNCRQIYPDFEVAVPKGFI